MLNKIVVIKALIFDLGTEDKALSKYVSDLITIHSKSPKLGDPISYLMFSYLHRRYYSCSCPYWTYFTVVDIRKHADICKEPQDHTT
jgi:hypothetical protein